MFISLLSLLLPAAFFPLAPEQLSPPAAPHSLAYTHTAQDEVALLDLKSLQRQGGVVEGWSLHIMRNPVQVFGLTSSDTYWMRVRLDCNARVGRFTHSIALVDGLPVARTDVAEPDSPAYRDWALDEAYACREEVPARPIVNTVEDAVTAAQEIMSSDLWLGQP